MSMIVLLHGKFSVIWHQWPVPEHNHRIDPEGDFGKAIGIYSESNMR